MVTTFHSREVRLATFFNSVFENILLSKYLLCLFREIPILHCSDLGTYFVVTLRISQLCIARTDSPILDKLYGTFPTFEVGPFGFRMSEADEYSSLPDYSPYVITYEGVTLPFLISIVDASLR